MKISGQPVRVLNHYTLWALSVHCKAVITQVRKGEKHSLRGERNLADTCREILDMIELDEVRDAGD